MFHSVLFCYLGIPSAVRELKFPHNTDNSVVIQWLSPLRNINTVFYDIECFKCRGQVCEDPCGSKTMYKPSKFNLTQLNVTVENLESNTQYMFVVRSKNNNSVLTNQINWSTVRRKVKTEGISFFFYQFPFVVPLHCFKCFQMADLSFWL